MSQTPEIAFDAVSRIHLVGVGGAGMSALAKLLAGRGRIVTGSDLRGSEMLTRLSELGVDTWAGHRPESLGGVDLVVASSAVPEADAELAAARRHGVPVWRRPKLLEAITREIPTIGVTGTHGKTSATSMMILALRAAGRDPSFVVGGEIVELRTNAHAGADDLLVLEIDEAFGTFEEVHCTGLVLTNVEPEHLDHFKTAAAMEEAFTRVVRAVEGPVVACLDDPGAARIAARTDVPTYGTSPEADWRMSEPVTGPSSVRFTLTGPGSFEPIDVEVGKPGVHMARNAAGVLALLATMGESVEALAAGLETFQGVRRRFEHRGEIAGVTIIDDYAHHPTEVAATLRAARARQASRLVAVFQPHLYSRTERLHREFGAALAQADLVIVSDVYGAREAPIPGISGALVADAAIRSGAPRVEYVSHRADLAGVVAGLVEPGDDVITMGAGDITLLAAELGSLLPAS
jgi:UDP-N-acetylmuramate--alanine ligase